MRSQLTIAVSIRIGRRRRAGPAVPGVSRRDRATGRKGGGSLPAERVEAETCFPRCWCIRTVVVRNGSRSLVVSDASLRPVLIDVDGEKPAHRRRFRLRFWHDEISGTDTVRSRHGITREDRPLCSSNCATITGSARGGCSEVAGAARSRHLLSLRGITNIRVPHPRRVSDLRIVDEETQSSRPLRYLGRALPQKHATSVNRAGPAGSARRDKLEAFSGRKRARRGERAKVRNVRRARRRC